MSSHVAQRPVTWGFAWPAVGAAVATFVLTVLMPPAGFVAGIVGLVVLCIDVARHRVTRTTALASGVVAAVVCYLGISLIGSTLDPSAPESGSGSSARPLIQP